MNKSDLENLVEIRLSEAEILLKSRSFQGAYYLVGYSLECALKACIANQVKQYDFPDKTLANKSYTHKLEDLVGIAGLKHKLLEKEKKDTNFSFNWAVVKDWSESARYECNIEETKANDLFNAITEEKSGILAWLKTYW